MKPLIEMAETSTNALTAAGGTFFRACADYNRETLDLVSRRARAYTSLPGDLTACTSAQDILELQSRFLETMVGDYRAHADRISRLMADFTRTAFDLAHEARAEEAPAAPSVSPAADAATRTEKRAA